VFWRIALFYVVSLTLIGLLVPYDSDQLLQDGGSKSDASPFVIAIKNAGIDGLDSVMNAVILIAVLSVGNAAVYGSSRTLAALGEQGMGPSFLSYIDRKGRPMWGIGISSTLGLLSFLAASDKQEQAFAWMMAISGLSSIFTWGSICLCHIRFRRGWKVQGHSLDELAFRAQPGWVGGWLGFLFNCLVLVVQFWVGFAPIGFGEKTAAERTKTWFKAYLAAPVVIGFYLYHKIKYRTALFIRAKDMDLSTGRRDLDLQHLIAQERAEQKAWPIWKKIYKIFC
jgi:amino acid transporter